MSTRPTQEVQQIDLTKLNLQQLQQLKNEFESVHRIYIYIYMTNQKYILHTKKKNCHSHLHMLSTVSRDLCH